LRKNAKESITFTLPLLRSVCGLPLTATTIEQAKALKKQLQKNVTSYKGHLNHHTT